MVVAHLVTEVKVIFVCQVQVRGLQLLKVGHAQAVMEVKEIIALLIPLMHVLQYLRVLAVAHRDMEVKEIIVCLIDKNFFTIKHKGNKVFEKFISYI